MVAKKKHRRIGRREKRHSNPSSATSLSSMSTSAVSEGTELDDVSYAMVDEFATDIDYCASNTGTDLSHISEQFSQSSVSESGISNLSSLQQSHDNSSSKGSTFQMSTSSAPQSDAASEPTSETENVGPLEKSKLMEKSEDNSPSKSSTHQLSTSSAPQSEPTSGTDKPGPSKKAKLAGKEYITSPILGGTDKRRRKKLATARPQKKKDSSKVEEQESDEKVERVDQTPMNPDETEGMDMAAISEGDLQSAQNIDAAHSIDEELVMLLTDDLKERLPDCLVHKEGGSVKIVKLSMSHNASVERSIYWDNGTVRLYIHNLLVPQNHVVYWRVKKPEEMTTSSLSLYLVTLFEEFSKFFVCKGNRSFQCLWTSSNGHLDGIVFEESPCFRSLNCALLVRETGRRCVHCTSQLANFRRIMKRKEERDKKDTSKIPNKYLDEEELRRKVSNLQKKSKQQEKSIKRLAKRLKDKEGYVKLDPGFQRDFLTVLKKNEHKMTETQKLFWKSQMDALRMNNKKNVNWPPCMIRIALSLQEGSTTAGYETCRKFIVLPSSRRLYDYSHVIEAKEGCQPEIIKDIQAKIKKSGSEEHFQYVNLMCDEIHIRSGLVVRKSTGELIGYENLTEVEIELQKLQDSIDTKEYQPNLAKKALVFLAKGITSAVHDVVAVFSVQNLSASQLYVRTWDVIYFLEEGGIKVLCLTFDGAATNRKFIEMHKPYGNFKFTFATLNLASGEEERPLFFILDPPHLMKTARNCLANSFAHKKTRLLWKDGQYISWKTLEELFEFTSEMKFTEHKLKKGHIHLTAFSCMRVLLAVQIFSSSVARSLKRYQTHERFAAHQMDELIKLIELMDKFFDCLNCKEDKSKEGPEGEEVTTKARKEAYHKEDDIRFTFLTDEFLKYFDDWELSVKKRQGSTKKEKARMVFSHQTVKALKITVYSFIEAIRFMLKVGAPKVNGRVFNQDPVEQFFSMLRQKRGDDNNPTLKDVLDTRVRSHVAGNIGFVSSQGNTQVEKRKAEVDNTPLPALKRRKK